MIYILRGRIGYWGEICDAKIKRKKRWEEQRGKKERMLLWFVSRCHPRKPLALINQSFWEVAGSRVCEYG